MRISFRLATVALVCLLAVTFSAAGDVQSFSRDALVGKWKTTLTNDDGKETTDNIEFKGGKFTSEAEKKDGFDPATYTDNPAPGGVGAAKFEVTLTNKAGDTAKWSGAATNGEISGTLVVTKKDGTVVNYSVKASKGN